MPSSRSTTKSRRRSAPPTAMTVTIRHSPTTRARSSGTGPRLREENRLNGMLSGLGKLRDDEVTDRLAGRAPDVVPQPADPLHRPFVGVWVRVDVVHALPLRGEGELLRADQFDVEVAAGTLEE